MDFDKIKLLTDHERRIIDAHPDIERELYALYIMRAMLGGTFAFDTGEHTAEETLVSVINKGFPGLRQFLRNSQPEAFDDAGQVKSRTP
jgi:hypothetical protein